jgi:hypothetical protein
MAIEMCKLSLWLVSLDRDLPFSFVDDKVFLGNSLLGLISVDQLRSLRIDPSNAPLQQQLALFDVDIDAIVRRAVDLRQNLASPVDDTDPARSGAAKRRQLHQLREVTGDLRHIADGVIAAGLPLGGKPGRAPDAAYEVLRDAVKQTYSAPGDGAPDPAKLDALIERGLTPTVETDYERWRPLHWVIEAADILADGGGFDAIIGNPPFLVPRQATFARNETARSSSLSVWRLRQAM